MSDQSSALEPADLTSYLSTQGWERHDSWRGAWIWTREGSGQLLIPESREYPDDDHLLWDAVKKLALLENRDAAEVQLDIMDPAVDKPEFRTYPDSPSGTIPLPAGLKAIQGVYDLLKFAARTVEDGPRMMFEGRRSDSVDQFLKKIRLGTTQPGSYILTARVPVIQSGTQTSLVGDGLSGRGVLLQLQQSVHAINEVADQMSKQNGRSDRLYDTVEQGVSANLCDALSNLGGVDKDQPFDIDFSWSRSQPLDPVAPVKFTKPMTRELSRAAIELEHLAKSGEATITGRVKTLDVGTRVKVTGVLRSKAGEARRAVWVVVGPADYQRAFTAQSRGRMLQVSGRMRVTQNRVELYPNPSGFSVLGD